MKTKTPEQIAMQSARILNYISVKHWNGKEYKEHSKMMDKLSSVQKACWGYIDNIFRANSLQTNGKGIATSGTTEQINTIWQNASTPRKVYAGY